MHSFKKMMLIPFMSIIKNYIERLKELQSLFLEHLKKHNGLNKIELDDITMTNYDTVNQQVFNGEFNLQAK